MSKHTLPNRQPDASRPNNQENDMNDLSLWIYDSGCTTDEIRTGVLAAVESLAAAGITAEAALAASLARASGEDFDASSADAFDEAERCALIASNAPAGSLAAA